MDILAELAKDIEDLNDLHDFNQLQNLQRPPFGNDQVKDGHENPPRRAPIWCEKLHTKKS